MSTDPASVLTFPTPTKTKRATTKARVTAYTQIREVLRAPFLAQVMGVLLGGLVPVLTFAVGHHDYDPDPAKGVWQIPTVLVSGGLLFSAPKVYQYMRKTLGAWYLALGFVALVEGIMTFSPTQALALACLVVLVAINWIATTHHLIRPSSEE